MIGKTSGPPPKRGPSPQGLRKGGCPHRDAGSKSDYKGTYPIQVKGHKFVGVR